ncbi:peptidoglycan-binding domain-containing protein [Neisseria sp. Ec49-e6-T10]|uniref:peptidoglycan-binding domain-containing protein n=1 Tax=Neisseria sp. Ec49-e6-T10 TaxID=3140744 RepID=UPI003EB6E7EE
MANEWKLGQTSEKFESGGRGPGMISSGKGDHGGISYGIYQLSSSQGSLQEFISKSKYKDDFAGLTVNSQSFQAKWKEIAAKDPKGFAEAQHQHTKDNFYNVQLNKLSNMGINFKERGPAVQDMVWSTSVQFGGNTNLIKNALDKVDVDSLTDRQIVERVQNYKRDRNESLFRSSSADVRAGTLKRAEAEKNALVRLAENKDITLEKNSDTPELNQPKLALLKSGSRGDDVKQLQTQLNALGYKIGQDGIFGQETEKAIRDFQQKNGLGVDGKVGPNTYGKLEEQLQNKPELVQQNKDAVDKDSQAFSSAYDKTLQFDAVTYKMGGKDPAKGSIDCSGWVTYLQNNSMDDINKLLGQEVFTQKDRFNPIMEGASETIKRASEQSGILIEGKQITRDILKEGMVIGEDNGDKGFDRGRFRGIDHITMVVRDPKSGDLMISQSSSGKGVHLKSVDDYLSQKQKGGTKLFLTDPLAKARDLLVEKSKEQNIDQKAEKAQPEKAEKEKIQSPEHQKVLDLVKKAVTDLYDKNKLPHADKLDNVCCALAKEGIAKKMTGVDYAMEKKGDISLLHTPKGKMTPMHATVNIEAAANTPISVSISAINNMVKISIDSMEEQNKQIQQQELTQQPARSMGM